LRVLGVQLEASEAEIEGALEGLPIAPEQLEMAEEQYAVRPPTPSLVFLALPCYAASAVASAVLLLPVGPSKADTGT